MTTVERTAADLARLKSDGGHVGRFIDEVVRALATTVERVAEAMQLDPDKIEAMRAMASEASQ